MAIETEQKSSSDGKVWGFFKLPFRQTGNTNTSSSSLTLNLRGEFQPHVEGSNRHGSANSVSSVAKSLLPTRRRLKLDPTNKLYFPYEPGKQVRNAVRIKNTSKSYTAFKFQTTSPKSCFMRPPGTVLAPGESIVAIFKFVEPPEKNEKTMNEKSKVKFKFMIHEYQGEGSIGLHIRAGASSFSYKTVYYMTRVIFVFSLVDDLKDQVAIEQILRVIFLDPLRPCPPTPACQKSLEDAGPRIIGEGLVIDEWKERRESYLARQQVEGVDSV
ncbi:Vesicle-associated protein 4-1 [Hibiscus syriacus]|uniref:Vesicle-associated protein 4-1 n=1 Tax=Hibiscus syriacus TaxID=106335 RepID=A0A6A3CVE6_HIBSY|nr:Vesicle-associated protein 4-1 [Hibiscus syriacus]